MGRKVVYPHAAVYSVWTLAALTTPYNDIRNKRSFTWTGARNELS